MVSNVYKLNPKQKQFQTMMNENFLGYSWTNWRKQLKNSNKQSKRKSIKPKQVGDFN